MEGARMATLVQPPPFWQAFAQGQTVLYIELPVPPFTADAAGAITSDAVLRADHRHWIGDMKTNGIGSQDALAALRYT